MARGRPHMQCAHGVWHARGSISPGSVRHRACAPHDLIHPRLQAPAAPPMRSLSALRWSRSSVGGAPGCRSSWRQALAACPPYLRALHCSRAGGASGPAWCFAGVSGACAQPPATLLCLPTNHTHAAGRGAYGSVYKAVDRATSQFVAIKIITLTDSDPQVGTPHRAASSAGGGGAELPKTVTDCPDKLAPCALVSAGCSHPRRTHTAVPCRFRQDLERIQQEIAFLSECNHPNVVCSRH